MILLDAYCLVALAREEPAADEVEELLHTGEAAMSSVNLFEAVDFLLRRGGVPEADVRLHLSPLLDDAVQVLPVTEEHAWQGALFRARHYQRGSCEVSLADCVLLASARNGDRVATSDPAIAAIARAEGVDLVALPDTTGRRPT